jgi:CheY-like chemotaxis protein
MTVLPPEALSAGSHGLSFAKDADGRYAFVSASFAADLGKSPADVLGKTDADLFSPPLADRFRSYDHAVGSSGKSIEYEHTIRRDGRPKVYRTTKHPLIGGGVWGVTVPQSPTPAVGPKRVLVVDDDPDNADSLVMLLELYGHTATKAADAHTALRLGGEFRPDVVLLDLFMPRVDGYECGRRIRATEWGRAVLLIAVTGWGRDDDRQRTAAAGFDHHLTKPFDPADLRRTLGG